MTHCRSGSYVPLAARLTHIRRVRGRPRLLYGPHCCIRATARSSGLESGAELQESRLDPAAGADSERQLSLGPGQTARASQAYVSWLRVQVESPRA